MERKLAAILAADVVGYSRLMGTDEAGTLERLKCLRTELVQPNITARKGRIVKLMGDGLLAEFPSVVEAVLCAVDIQRGMNERESEVTGERRIRLRIGVNLGDIIVEGSDIYGDGVNIAARLEGLADPGTICVSGTVFDHVKTKIDLDFVDLGEQEVKNIEQPVHVYRIALNSGMGAEPTADALIGSATVLKLPDKPSIAVLPFTNMSGDREQDYFADGITEDIITGLSKCRWLFVIARNSTFAYKGIPTDIRTVGQELGVRYVLEGSVRKSANRVRITAQLIDSVNGEHLWAERYDRVLEDIFELQDEITATIVGTIEPELGMAELTRSQRKSIESLDAWDSYLRARWHVRFGESKDALFECIRLCQQAIAISPDMACVYSELAVAHVASVTFGYTDNRETAIQLALEAGQQAVRLDSKDPIAHTALGRVYDFRGRFEEAVQEHKIALGLNPNSSITHLFLASTYNHGGKPALALPAAEQAYRLSPRDPRQWFMHMNKGFALSQLGRHEEAAEELKAACRSEGKTFWPLFGLAIVLAHSGKRREAEQAMETAMQHAKGFSRISDIEQNYESVSDEYQEFLVAGARLAGMPA